MNRIDWDYETSCYSGARAMRHLPSQKGAGAKKFSPFQGYLPGFGKKSLQVDGLFCFSSPNESFLPKSRVMYSRPISTLPLAFCDVETTGGSIRNGGRICQLAVTRLEAETGEVIERHETINPERSISQYATAVHGLTNRHVKGKRKFSQLAKGVHTLLSDTVFVAHNAKGIDEPYVKGELSRAGFSWPCIATLCTLKLSRKIWKKGEVRSHKLGDLARQFDLFQGKAHQAHGDVVTLMSLWSHILQTLPREITLGRLLEGRLS